MHGEGGHSNLVDKLFQTRDATQLHRLRQRPVRPESAASTANVDIVMQRASALNVLRCQLLDWTIVFPAQMQTLRRDLFQVYFHELTLQISLAKFPAQRIDYTTRNKGCNVPT